MQLFSKHKQTNSSRSDRFPEGREFEADFRLSLLRSSLKSSKMVFIAQ